ncbi:hypothetical protein BCR36DRAFT_409876 [Piromyces finnis]|uniref:Uncharacterized protein n=1 Tax=Piromyces finnis TaxID=1754191 RepID=A0A1Y1VJ63_9FUNG|nr:hypothetical protein BCR36DRAFT_409876 [Piromyces finnis]|eukprot:ORX56687.1 hypothetical protein BCR36DRAFT_409876 [Piromyces finnis]
MFLNTEKVNYLVKSHKTIEYSNILANNLIMKMNIINMKEKEKKILSLEFNLLELISFDNDDNKLKDSYSLLYKQLDSLKSIITTFISSCMLSSFITSIFVNIVIRYINDFLFIYNEAIETRDEISLLCSMYKNKNTSNYLIFKYIKNQEHSNQINLNDNYLENQDNHQENNNNDNYSNNENNNNNNNNNNEINNNNNGSNNNNNNNNNERNNDENEKDNNSKIKKSNKKKKNKNKKGLSENDEEENNDNITENGDSDLNSESNADENKLIKQSQNKEFNKSIIPSLYHKSSTSSVKKSKLLGVIGNKNDDYQFLGKESDFISSDLIDNKNIHLHELNNSNIIKMPSIIEDRTEEGSDIEDMKILLKKDQNEKKGEKLSKLLISKSGEDSINDPKKEDSSYASLAYSPFSNNFELWKNNIIESLPYRSSTSGIGSHRNSICCTYDIFTNFCASNNSRRGSLPSLNHSCNNFNLNIPNEITTPSQLSCLSIASSLSYSSTSSASSSSLSSPSSNSTMVNQYNGGDGHSYSFNKINNSKVQKSVSTQISSASTPSTKIYDICKETKNEIDNSGYTTPVDSSKLANSASLSGSINNYALSSSSSCNSLSAINTTLSNSSSSTLNFIDYNGKNGSMPIELKRSMSNSDLTNYSSMVTASIEEATKIIGEEESKNDIDSISIIDKLNEKSSNNNGCNDNSRKSIGGSSDNNIKSISNENGNMSLATSIFDEDNSSITSFYDKENISTENSIGFYNYPNIFSRGRSFSISVDSLFADSNLNDHEWENDSQDTFDTFGNNDLMNIKSINSFQLRYNNSSRRQSCPLISSYSDYSLSKKKSKDDMNNLRSMTLDDLSEAEEPKPTDRIRKGSTSTLNDFTSSSSTLFKDDSFLSSLNCSLNNDTYFQNKKENNIEFNSFISSNSSELTERLKDSNTTTNSFSNTISFSSYTDDSTTSNKSNLSCRKTRSYSMSSVSCPFAYSTLFDNENKNQESISSILSNKNKSSINAKIDKSFDGKKSSISDAKNPWLNTENENKNSTSLFSSENVDFDFGFNLGWKSDKKPPNTKLNTNLYNINEGQTSSINNTTTKSLLNINKSAIPVTSGNKNNASLNSITNNHSNNMLFNKTSPISLSSNTTNLDNKPNDTHSKTKKKLLGWGFLAKYNFIDFDDDVYQDNKKTNTSSNNIMKNRQNNNMPYNSNSSYSIYGNGSINSSMLNNNPFVPQNGYNGSGYNDNMMNKINYISNNSSKGSNGTMVYNGKNNNNGNTNNLIYQQKNSMIYYNNDGSGVSITNNINSNNGSNGTGPNGTNNNNKNHPGKKNKSNSSKNCSNNKDYNEVKHDLNTSIMNEQFNLNIVEFIPGNNNNNNSKKTNKKSKEIEDTSDEALSNLPSNVNNEIFNNPL